MASRKMHSGVWEYFEINATGTAVQCTLSKAELAYNSSTGSMNNHMRWKHINKIVILGRLLDHLLNVVYEC